MNFHLVISLARVPEIRSDWIRVQHIGPWLILLVPTEISPFQMSARDRVAECM